jgi:hypothetical protein
MFSSILYQHTFINSLLFIIEINFEIIEKTYQTLDELACYCIAEKYNRTIYSTNREGDLFHEYRFPQKVRSFDISQIKFSRCILFEKTSVSLVEQDARQIWI